MINNLYNFFYMSGYGGYVFSAYGSVCLFLVVQWMLPLRRLRHSLKSHRQNQP